MILSRTALFYAAPPVILGTLFTVYRMWFAGEAEAPVPPAPSEMTQPISPVDPFGGAGVADGGGSSSGGGSPLPPRPPSDTGSLPPPPPSGAGAKVTDLDSAARLLQGLASELFAAFPEVARWAKIPGLVMQAVTAADCIALGESPRPHLSFLAPTQPFQAKQVADGWVIDPDSYARYDRVVAVFCAGDAGRMVAAYERLEPALDLAYRKLGYGDRRLRQGLAVAAAELLAVPLPTGPVYVVPGGLTYSFADPALQAQSDARKHLLRSGPENIRKVQDRVRALAAALKLEIVAP